MKKFHIVTPTMRHNRLGILGASIANAKAPEGWVIDWRVRMMPRKQLNDAVFSPFRDDLLWTILDGWWIYISDDNLIHPGLVQKVAEIEAAHPAGLNGIMFAQRLGVENIRAGSKIQLTKGDCDCDGGAFAINANYYSAKRMKYHEHGPAERWLFKHIHDEAPDKFAFCNEPLTYRDAQNFIFDPVPLG